MTSYKQSVSYDKIKSSVIQSAMMKQQQRVLRKGDYYQVQAYEESMMLMSKTKKDQQQNSTLNIPLNEQILTDLPSWNTARSHYFAHHQLSHYHNSPLDHLLDDLIQISATQTQLTDQHRNQIDTLAHQIALFSRSNQLPINSLPPPNSQQAKQSPSQHSNINLTAKYNITNLSNRISQLHSLDFPELIALEHQLEIMLGQKKPLQSLELSHMDQKQKDELNNLYNHLNSLSIINNTQTLIDSVFVNEPKHVEMQGWIEKMENVQGVNTDLLLQLKQDQDIVNRLGENFEQNVKQVREMLAELKAQK